VALQVYCNVSGLNKRLSIECCCQDRYINAIIIIIIAGRNKSTQNVWEGKYAPHCRMEGLTVAV